jgi:glycosyltransferase involved in cell wall biosynthesis
MPDKPVITIITPVYNGEKYISETIESVIHARLSFSYEYLVIDDGSTDATSKILQQYKNKIKIFSHENRGESATVNRGLENAEGDFVLVVNADDPLLTEDLVNKGCQYLIGNPNVVAVYPDWKIIDGYGKTIKINVLPEYSDEIMIGECRTVPGPGTIFRKDSALRIKGRRTEWKYVGDYDFWLRLSRIGEIRRLPGVLAQWRESQNSTSISQRGIEMANERIEVTSNFLSKNSVPNYIVKMAKGNSHYLAARLAFFDSRINGRNLLIKSFWYKKSWPSNARIHIVLYLLLLPLSKKVIDKFPNLVARISQR